MAGHPSVPCIKSANEQANALKLLTMKHFVTGTSMRFGERISRVCASWQRLNTITKSAQKYTGSWSLPGERSFLEMLQSWGCMLRLTGVQIRM